MTDQHRATPKQWEAVKICSEGGGIPWPTADCILELRDAIRALCIARNDLVVCSTDQNQRIEALEAAQRYQFRSATEKVPTTRLYSYSVGPAKPLDELGQGHTLVSPEPASAEAQPAWRPLDIETTYGTEAAADAAQILHAPMVVEGTFEHGGETYRFKAKPEREAPMAELRAASAEARPTVKESLTDGGSLLEMVAKAIYNVPHDSAAEASAAIREVATWLDRFALHGSGEYAQAAKVLRQEANHG